MTLEEVSSCPICQGTNFTTLYSCLDHTSSGEKFPVKQCNSCTLILTSPRPKESEAGRYYQSNQYISHQTTAKGALDQIYLIVRSFTLRWKCNLVKPYTTGTLLDVGCGTGSFLTYCLQKGIRVVGVEPSDARNSIKGITVFQHLGEVPAQTYSAITLWHVLEHIYPLKETLDKLKNILAENGTIFIAVPNRLSDDAKSYAENWAAWDVPRHIWHFSEENIRDLMSKCGMQVREVIPMKMDAYYVALLSERYLASGKTTPFGIMRAIYKGLISNFSARRTGQYSSKIYRITR